ncbi:MAG: hypothetical protein K5874_01255, partial [Bacteroidaceae bacterium]|nr:hypothetical protein [Bacteroidaceae bacterium]
TKSSKIQKNNLASSILTLKGRLKEGDNNILCIIDLWLIINLDTLLLKEGFNNEEENSLI